jgi:hypothetical protein
VWGEIQLFNFKAGGTSCYVRCSTRLKCYRQVHRRLLTADYLHRFCPLSPSLARQIDCRLPTGRSCNVCLFQLLWEWQLLYVSFNSLSLNVFPHSAVYVFLYIHAVVPNLTLFIWVHYYNYLLLTASFSCTLSYIHHDYYQLVLQSLNHSVSPASKC